MNAASTPADKAPRKKDPKWEFFKADTKTNLIAFFRPFLKTTLLVGGIACLMFVLVCIGTLIYIAVTPQPDAMHASKEGEIMIKIMGGLVLLACIALASIPIGFCVGSFRLGWRLFGAWCLAPALVLPLVVFGLDWLFGGWWSAQGQDVWRAMEESGNFALEELFGGSAPGHTGGAGILLMLVMIVPALLIDALHMVTEIGILWEVFLWCGIGVILVGIGIFLSALLALPPLILSGKRRAQKRFQAFPQGT